MKKIMIVEDDEDIVKMVFSCIAARMPEQAPHFELAHISSGDVAIKILESQSSELGIIDGLLVGRYNPEDDGLKIIALFRSLYPKARIALFSGEVEQEYIDEAVRCGANIHIPKPFNFCKLEAFLLQILYESANEKFPKNTV